jgi:release factor glutamine methyltransferase
VTGNGDPHPLVASRRAPPSPAVRERGLTRNAGEGLGTAGATVGEVLDQCAAGLMAAGVDEPRRQARRIFVAALGLSPAEVFAHPQRMLDAEEHARIAAMTRRVAAREPLSRITGRREFWGLEFVLSP